MALTPNSTSQFGVQVPDQVQTDNRALVQYRNDGKVRYKLGQESTNHITLGMAMYFWANPDELQKVANSDYVDDTDAFISRIQKHQERHLDILVKAARNALGGIPVQSVSSPKEDVMEQPRTRYEHQSTDAITGQSSPSRLPSLSERNPYGEFEPENHAQPAEKTTEEIGHGVRKRVEQMQKEVTELKKQVEKVDELEQRLDNYKGQT